MRHGLLWWAGALVLACGLVVLLAGMLERSMIYFPNRQGEAEQLRRAAASGFAPWRDGEGRLIGWRRPNPAASRRLVVFHGNAGSALDREPYADAFGALGWEVSIFEYPGYGARGGRPGKAAFIRAARPALAGLIAADGRPLAVLGESIGSGTACATLAALRGSVQGAVLVVPFARLAEVAWAHYGPLAFLLRDRFDNIASLRSCRAPVAFVVAGADEVVGAGQGRKLHAAYAGPKLLIELPGSSHNGFPLGAGAGWVRAVDTFLRDHERASPEGTRLEELDH